MSETCIIVRIILQQPVDHLMKHLCVRTRKKITLVKSPIGEMIRKKNNRERGWNIQTSSQSSEFIVWFIWLWMTDRRMDDVDRYDNESVKMIQQIYMWTFFGNGINHIKQILFALIRFYCYLNLTPSKNWISHKICTCAFPRIEWIKGRNYDRCTWTLNLFHFKRQHQDARSTWKK